ncbi:hypothetical protein [Aestuariivirga sp.]|uniref:hypothetical protein n=1 Tax=Aestuariivirga sp. TaxID=2650926 RepID=UPI003BABA7A3
MPPESGLRSALRSWWLGGHSQWSYDHPLFRKTRASPPKVRILGDHSDYHCGSWAAIESIRQNCLRSGYRLAGRYEPFDILVVNGEGSMHGSNIARRNVFVKKMEVLKRAIEAGIPAYLVNTVWQNNVSSYDHVLRMLSGIQVREIDSYNDLLTAHGVPSLVKIDASFFLAVKQAPSLTPNARIVITDFFMTAGGQFEAHALDLGDTEYVSMKDIGWPDFVTKLANSKLLVTGRHHAVFAACKARTPFIVLKGNNHKVTGLLETAGVRLPVAKTLDEIPALVAEIGQHQAAYDQLFNWMHARPDTPILPDLNRA